MIKKKVDIEITSFKETMLWCCLLKIMDDGQTKGSGAYFKESQSYYKTTIALNASVHSILFHLKF